MSDKKYEAVQYKVNFNQNHLLQGLMVSESRDSSQAAPTNARTRPP